MVPTSEKNTANRWIDDFEDIAKAQNWDEQTKCQKFPAFLDGGAKDWYKLDIDGQGIADQWNDLRTAFLNAFLPTTFEVHMRDQLDNRRQRIFESVTDYMFAKRRLCSAAKAKHGRSRRDSSPEERYASRYPENASRCGHTVLWQN